MITDPKPGSFAQNFVEHKLERQKKREQDYGESVVQKLLTAIEAWDPALKGEDHTPEWLNAQGTLHSMLLATRSDLDLGADLGKLILGSNQAWNTTNVCKAFFAEYARLANFGYSVDVLMLVFRMPDVGEYVMHNIGWPPMGLRKGRFCLIMPGAKEETPMLRIERWDKEFMVSLKNLL